MDGVDLLRWDTRSGTWLPLLSNASGPTPPADAEDWGMAWDTDDARMVRAMLFGPRREVLLALAPTQANGTAIDLGQLAVDSLELTVRYRRGVVAAWEFGVADDREGWKAENLSDDGVTDGAWTLTTDAADPRLIGPFVEVAAHAHVRVRLSSTNADTTAALYWTRLDAPAFDEARRVTFPIEDAGALAGYDVDLSAHEEWTGTVTRLRLDPVEVGDGGRVVLDRIRVER